MTVTRPILYEYALMGVFWVLGTIGFVCDEIISPLESLRPYVLLACDALLILLGLACMRHRTDVVLVVTLGVLIIVSSVPFNGLSWKHAFNGGRVFISAMFVYPIFRYFWDNAKRHDHFVKTLDKNLFLFLALQAFCVTYQFFLYGAGDHGGGSLGDLHSGTISMLIYLISFYLLKKNLDHKHFWYSLWENKMYIILLFPTFLNETKVSFVLLLLYFVLLLPIDRRFFIRTVVIAPILAMVFFVGYSVYRVTYQGEFAGTSADNVDIFSEEYLLEYMLMDIENAEEDATWNMENSATGLADLPRATKFLLLAQFEEDHPGHIPLGFGVGHFKGGTKLDHTDFFYEYEWYLVGTIPYLIHIYLQLGLVGVIWFFTFWILMFVRKPDLYQERDWNLHLFIALLIALNLVYIEAMRNPVFCIPLYGLIVAGWHGGCKKKDEDEEIDDETINETTLSTTTV